jgi:hypothetical protein
MRIVKKLFCLLGSGKRDDTAEKKDFMRVFMFGSEGAEDDGK